MQDFLQNFLDFLNNNVAPILAECFHAETVIDEMTSSSFIFVLFT